MFVLLITPFILALGKILCQVQSSEEVIYSPSPFLHGRTTPTGNLQGTTIQIIQPPQATGKSAVFDRKNNNSTTAQETTRNSQKLKLFISRSQSRMDQKRPFANTVTTNNITNSTSANNTCNSTQISTNNSTSDYYDKVVFEDAGGASMENSVKSVDPTARNESTSNNSRPPGSVTEVPPPVNVTLEDRGAFDGDACPTGYVRVNGVCVMPD